MNPRRPGLPVSAVRRGWGGAARFFSVPQPRGAALIPFAMRPDRAPARPRSRSSILPPRRRITAAFGALRRAGRQQGRSAPFPLLSHRSALRPFALGPRGPALGSNDTAERTGPCLGAISTP
jgi:hypothetical protein